MTERRYLLDNNVLSRLTPGDRQGEFFKACCHVTSDVLYEARGYAEPEVAERVLPVTPAVLRLLSEVMATQQPGDIRLVNLYTNQGAADPTLIAVALQEQAAEDATLFAKRWVIVTDDQAVAHVARGLCLDVLDWPGFQPIIHPTTD